MNHIICMNLDLIPSNEMLKTNNYKFANNKDLDIAFPLTFQSNLYYDYQYYIYVFLQCNEECNIENTLIKKIKINDIKPAK